MNEPTTIGTLNESLRRRYGIVGQQGPIFTLASDLFPIVNVSDSGIDPELAIYAGQKLGIASATDVAEAGVASGVQFRNPEGSGVLAVITSIQARLNSSGTGVTVVLVGTTPADAEAAGFLRDSRFGTSARATCVVGPRTIALATGIYSVLTGTVELQAVAATPLVVAPGTGILVQAAAVNVSISVGMLWRERKLETWELLNG